MYQSISDAACSRAVVGSKYPPAKPGALDQEPLKAAMQHAEIISDRSLPSRVHTTEAAYLGSFRTCGHKTRIDRRMVRVRCLRPAPCQRS
jgi:hypothetical protein